MWLFGNRVTLCPHIFSYQKFVAPVAYPIAKLLDYVLGHNEAHTYKKAELRFELVCNPYISKYLSDNTSGHSLLSIGKAKSPSGTTKSAS